MASPVDTKILPPQSRQVRNPVDEPRPRGAAHSGDARPTGGPAAGRRGQPAVAVSLSAEALQMLNGNREPVRQARPQAPDHRTRASQESEAAAGDDVFDLLVEDAHPQHREAPFAHASRPAPGRDLLPGSRLDITV